MIGCWSKRERKIRRRKKTALDSEEEEEEEEVEVEEEFGIKRKRGKRRIALLSDDEDMTSVHFLHIMHKFNYMHRSNSRSPINIVYYLRNTHTHTYITELEITVGHLTFFHHFMYLSEQNSL